MEKAIQERNSKNKTEMNYDKFFLNKFNYGEGGANLPKRDIRSQPGGQDKLIGAMKRYNPPTTPPLRSSMMANQRTRPIMMN